MSPYASRDSLYSPGARGLPAPPPSATARRSDAISIASHANPTSGGDARPAALPIGRACVFLLGLTLAILHMAILVAAFQIAPVYVAAYVGCFVSLIAGAARRRAPHARTGVTLSDGRSRPPLPPNPPTTPPQSGGDPYPAPAWIATYEPPETYRRARHGLVSDDVYRAAHFPLPSGIRLRGELRNIVGADTYELLVPLRQGGDLTEILMPIRVKLANYTAPARGSIAEFDARDSVESLLWSRPITVELTGAEPTGERLASLWVGETPVAAALSVMGHGYART